MHKCVDVHVRVRVYKDRYGQSSGGKGNHRVPAGRNIIVGLVMLYSSKS